MYLFLLVHTVNMDYGTVSASLTFPSGSASSPVQAQRCFSFSPIEDVNVEALENFQLILSSQDDQAEFPAGGNTAIVNIADNDRKFVTLCLYKLCYCYNY